MTEEVTFPITKIRLDVYCGGTDGEWGCGKIVKTYYETINEKYPFPDCPHCGNQLTNTKWPWGIKATLEEIEIPDPTKTVCDCGTYPHEEMCGELQR